LPGARQIAAEVGLSWSELLAVAYAEEGKRCTPDEMLEAARDGDSNPHRAQFNAISVHLDGREVQVPWSGGVVCGHNPFLVARNAGVWPLRDGSGRDALGGQSAAHGRRDA
jgi:hypothetical protein